MTTLIYSHEACIEHDPGSFHPERPDRLRAVLAALKVPAFEDLAWREAPQAEIAQVAWVHPQAYVDAVLAAVPQSGQTALDPDTHLSPASGEAALRAAGAVCAAVDAIMAGEAANAFCAVRPPGHHAEPSRAMGFCIFNGIAVGAEQARKAHGLERVVVMDFDVHHGNGTQAMFWGDPALFYGSTHQMPLYPGTGGADERGVDDNIVNRPLAPGSGSREFRAAMTEGILPAIDAFAPDFILVSAGFDAHARDPLANLEFEDEDFAWATEELLRLAESHCAGRLVSVLEGGYDLEALASAASAHVRALMAA